MDDESLNATCAMESPLPKSLSGASFCGVYFLYTPQALRTTAAKTIDIYFFISLPPFLRIADC